MNGYVHEDEPEVPPALSILNRPLPPQPEHNVTQNHPFTTEKEVIISTPFIDSPK